MITQTYVQWVHISRDRDGMIIQIYVQWVHISRDTDGMITQTYVIVLCYSLLHIYTEIPSIKKERAKRLNIINIRFVKLDRVLPIEAVCRHSVDTSIS